VILRILRSLARQAAEAGKALSICGEVAADPAILPVLAGLGIGDLSVAPGMVSAVSRTLWTLDEAACRRLANRCADADSVEEVRALLGRPSEPGIRPQGLGSDAAVDPVCGMVVHTRDTPYSLRFGSTVHYFCSNACLRRYLAGCDG
jgi:YHS domain-containing protein